MSINHLHDTYKLFKLQNNKIIYRRNVFFNERTFPARKMKLPPSLTSTDTGDDLIDHQFEDDGSRWTITKTGVDDGDAVLYYTNNESGEEERSSVKEVRSWYNRTQLTQATNQVRPTRKGFINTLTLPYPQTQPNLQVLKRPGTTPFHDGLGRRTRKVMDFSTSIPGNALTKLKLPPLSNNALSVVITYMILKGIKQPRIELLSMGHDNIPTPIPTPLIQSRLTPTTFLPSCLSLSQVHDGST
jgi:hypothetical protein